MDNDTAALVAQPAVYLIWKQGAYYRPKAKGYTTSAIQAGRYTLADAIDITHPNGPDGPRDGMGYVHEDEVIDADWQAYQAQAAEIARLTGDCLKLAQRFDEFHPDPALMARIILNGMEHQHRAEKAEAALAAALARVAVLVEAAKIGREYVAGWVKSDGGIDVCDIDFRVDLEAIDAALKGGAA
jgi:hypothetical protein